MGRRRRSKKGIGIAIIPREKDGKLDRNYVKNELPQEAAPAAIKRLRDAALNAVHAQEWGTELGRLFLETKITSEQFEAGRRWDRLTQDYHRSMGAAAMQIRPFEFSVEKGKRADVDPDSEAGEQQAKKHAADRIKWAAAREALDGAGFHAARIVAEVVEEDRLLIGPSDLAALRHGLNALAVAFGLTAGARSPMPYR